jgi:hypothetical protein
MAKPARAHVGPAHWLRDGRLLNAQEARLEWLVANGCAVVTAELRRAVGRSVGRFPSDHWPLFTDHCLSGRPFVVSSMDGWLLQLSEWKRRPNGVADAMRLDEAGRFIAGRVLNSQSASSTIGWFGRWDFGP